MGHSSTVGFLVFALSLVVCVPVIAVDGVSKQPQATLVTKETAQEAVVAAQDSIDQVYEKGTTNLNNAKSILEKVETSNIKAGKAVSQAERETKNNEKAISIVENIKTIFQGVTRLHESEKVKLASSISSLETVVEEAEKLKDQCKKILPGPDAAPEKYSEAQGEALKINGTAEKLNLDITAALGIIDGVSSIADEMETSVKDAELANLHVSVIVAVAEIDTIIRDTGNYIEKTRNKKKELDVIVQAMQELKTKKPSTLTEKINELFKRTDDELSKARDLLTKAEKYQTAVTEQKQKADAALTAVASEKVINTAQQEVENVKQCVTQVKELVPQLKSALQTASISLTNAKESKQNLVTALSSTTTAQRTEEVKETENSDPSVEGGAGAGQNNATTQPTSKDSVGQSDNSGDKLNDTLNKGAQNVPTTALTSGKAPAPGAKNDSAMTVSVPLLGALIASAVLQ